VAIDEKKQIWKIKSSSKASLSHTHTNTHKHTQTQPRAKQHPLFQQEHALPPNIQTRFLMSNSKRGPPDGRRPAQRKCEPVEHSLQSESGRHPESASKPARLHCRCSSAAATPAGSRSARKDSDTRCKRREARLGGVSAPAPVAARAALCHAGSARTPRRA
jgi:hypothetical protein